MNFQENKFPIILGVITVLIAGGLIFWGKKSGTKYEDAKSEYDSAISSITRMNREDIPPTDDNAREKTSAVDDFAESVDKLQKTFDPYRQPTPAAMEPSAFADALLAARESVVAKFEEAGTAVPEDFFLGLGRYAKTFPRREDTPLLSYELKAYQTLFESLAASKPTALKNVHWAGLPKTLEEIQAEQPKPKDKKKKKKKKSKNKPAPVGDGLPQYIAHPIEITFSGSEQSLRDFLSKLDDSEEFYYVVRTMRVTNEKRKAPSASDAAFKEVVKPADDDLGFFFPDNFEEEGDADGEAAPDGEGEDLSLPTPEPEPEPTSTDSSEILQQVLGDENIDVFLRIDALQFLAPKTL